MFYFLIVGIENFEINFKSFTNKFTKTSHKIQIFIECDDKGIL